MPRSPARGVSGRRSTEGKNRPRRRRRRPPSRLLPGSMPGDASLEDADAAIGDDALAGDERGGVGRQEYGDASDVARLAQAPERRGGDALITPRLVLPERACKLPLPQA